ncbi:LEA_2 domain-containing protein [Psidium guajava]|nr:LEA_2 domain-containing protein [Psidium guajava]
MATIAPDETNRRRSLSFTGHGLERLGRDVDLHGAVHPRRLLLLEDEHDLHLPAQRALAPQGQDSRAQVALEGGIDAAGQFSGVQSHVHVDLLGGHEVGLALGDGHPAHLDAAVGEVDGGRVVLVGPEVAILDSDRRDEARVEGRRRRLGSVQALDPDRADPELGRPHLHDDEDEDEDHRDLEHGEGGDVGGPFHPLLAPLLVGR